VTDPVAVDGATIAVNVTDVPTVVEAADTPREAVVAVVELEPELEAELEPELEEVDDPPPHPATTLPSAPAPKILSAARLSSGGFQSNSSGFSSLSTTNLRKKFSVFIGSPLGLPSSR
jgi:hypothetical protein